jgi:hypothetical protein
MGEPYLLSVEDRDFCTWAGNYRWEEEWSRKELEHRLFEFLSEKEGIDEEDFGRLLDLKIFMIQHKIMLWFLELQGNAKTFQV